MTAWLDANRQSRFCACDDQHLSCPTLPCSLCSHKTAGWQRSGSRLPGPIIPSPRRWTPQSSMSDRSTTQWWTRRNLLGLENTDSNKLAVKSYKKMFFSCNFSTISVHQKWLKRQKNQNWWTENEKFHFTASPVIFKPEVWHKHMFQHMLQHLCCSETAH